MKKTILGSTLAALLVCGCGKQEPPAALPPAAEIAAPAAVPTPAIAPATNAPPAASTAAGSTPAAADASLVEDSGVDVKLVNASIDKVLGDHGKYQAVIEAYQKAVASGDKAAVAALVRYPLEVTIEGSRTTVRDASTFVQQYDRIITPAIARAVTTQKYAELLVNQKGVMFGNGETWINGICKPGSADCSDFEVRIIAIQAGRAE
ncbi:hypothetical protein DT603_06560 [Pseudoxanthomonas gei]|uniref:Lipoprotein n=1 Tax=Pseudoxanthomonas gei TaxID=1383030 RepID=A0ABX0AAD2_9GAMM|nr:hypothetical protein [Pseudoxanthomonas gei]NDK38503.1 hypothetical protein [Pseudoxanthomonas gei]